MLFSKIIIILVIKDVDYYYGYDDSSLSRFIFLMLSPSVSVLL